VGRARHPILIAARSARQLAHAARAAGYAPRVVDLFGDDDTRAASEHLIVTPAARGFRFRPRQLLADLGRLAGGARLPLVWGAGFEAATPLLARLGQAFDVCGSAGEGLAEVTDPVGLHARLRALDVPTPAIATDRVPTRGRWVVKTRGQAGGHHVRWGVPGAALAAHDYAQAFCAGRSMSVVFVAGARTLDVLGYNAHLFWPSSPSPFVYAGAVGGQLLPRRLCRHIEAALRRVAARFGLRGLCGVDFVVDAHNRWQLIEINPRWTATVELVAAPAAAFRAHLAACRGQSWRRPQALARARAHAVLMLDNPIRIPNSLDWPAWVADRPGAGARLPRGAPLCTVLAAGATPEAACERLAQRVIALCRLLGIDDPAVPLARQPIITTANRAGPRRQANRGDPR